MSIRVTTAQQIVNMNDHRDVALVFDMRSESRFNQVKLAKSINFSIEKMRDETFYSWAKNVKQIELDKSILKDKYSNFAFKYRKRHWVFIIGSHSSKNLNDMILNVASFANQEKFLQLVQKAQTPEQKEDLISFRNSILLYNALKKERLRECDLSICGFDKIQRQYQYHCLDSQGNFIIPKPKKAENYPNEIFPERLYLGDWHHAADAHVIETLGITHVLNISDSCQNYLQETHKNLKYLHLDVADVKEQTLSHVFIEIFNFIYEACIPDGHDISALQKRESNEEENKVAVANAINEVPISNQSLEIDFNSFTTCVQTTKQ